MIKKTRININTSFKIYIKVFLSFIFNTGKKNKANLFANSRTTRIPNNSFMFLEPSIEILGK